MAAANNDNAHVRSVEELKSAFKEGATPNEKDYGALIDLAAVGSKALGADDATPTTPNPGLGLKMDNKGKLTIKVGNGVTIDQDGVAVKGDGKSVTVSQTGVGIKVKDNGGLATDADGLHVITGMGLKTDANGLALHLADKSGLKADTDGLVVHVAAGLEFSEAGVLQVKVKKDKDNYITSDKDGLSITTAGVTAIEAALKSVSLDALNNAVKATSQGFKTDGNTAEPDTGVEKKIAGKLNAAFTEGWHLTQPREALFKALKAFRKTHKDKIYTNGLIAPSTVAGKTGLYNQEGVEYVDGTVIPYKVDPTGEAQEITTGAYNKDGIYALVGKLDNAGTPKSGGAYDMVTQQALMVLVVNGVVTVVGHWDFKPEADWTGPISAGGWDAGPTRDGVVIQEGKERDRKHEKTVAELQRQLKQEEKDKEEAVEMASFQGQWSAVRTPHIKVAGERPRKTMFAWKSGEERFTLRADVERTGQAIDRRESTRTTLKFYVPFEIGLFGFEGSMWANGQANEIPIHGGVSFYRKENSAVLSVNASIYPRGILFAVGLRTSSQTGSAVDESERIYLNPGLHLRFPLLGHGSEGWKGSLEIYVV